MEKFRVLLFHPDTVPPACCCTLHLCPRLTGSVIWDRRRFHGSTVCTMPGQSWWQALPVGPTGYGNSPYQSLSSFAGNALLISPDGLISEGLLRAADCESHFPSDVVDYSRVTPFKNQLLEKAWTNFKAGEREDLRIAYEEFCAQPGKLARRLRSIPSPESEVSRRLLP